MNSGFAKCSVGSTGRKCGCRISFCQVMRVGMFLTFSKTDPGVLRTNSVDDEPGILTWPP